MPSIEILGPALSVLIAVPSAMWLSRKRPHVWLPAFGFALILMGIWVLGHRRPDIGFHWGLDRITSGPARGFLLPAILTWLLLLPATHLPQARQRRALHSLLGIVVAGYVLWPGVALAQSRRILDGRPTHIRSDGICLQSTDYTCGPAAAVTALHQLGVKASESELALLARTSPATGTPPEVLARAIEKRHGADGIHARCLRLQDLDSLRDHIPCLVTVRLGPWTDHWIYITSINEDTVEHGDPASGWEQMTHQEFMARWRRVAVLVTSHSRSMRPQSSGRP